MGHSAVNKSLRGRGDDHPCPPRSGMGGCAVTAARTPEGDTDQDGALGERRDRRHRVVVALTDEQIGAVEGWRLAHGYADQSAAVGELVRLGLLSEIATIFRLVSQHRDTERDRSRSGRGRMLNGVT